MNVNKGYNYISSLELINDMEENKRMCQMYNSNHECRKP
jgi:hypothetical protein